MTDPFEYYKQHAACPKCGLAKISWIADTRTNGREEYKTTNKCKCDYCGWLGTLDECIPDKEEERRELLEKDYKENHRACPNCGSSRYSTTLLPLRYKNDKYEDHNNIRCSDCHWTGKGHELVK
jgi:hypothetical protein